VTDLVAIDVFGDHAGYLLRSGAPRAAAEQLLMDIRQARAEKTEKAGKRWA
jgi:hypothetical protein